jgi:hypothetical protein
MQQRRPEAKWLTTFGTPPFRGPRPFEHGCASRPRYNGQTGKRKAEIAFRLSEIEAQAELQAP